MDHVSRTFEQLKEQYEIEKELANRLRNASAKERQNLYSAVYDELFQRVRHHPQNIQKSCPQDFVKKIADQMRVLRLFLRQGTHYLEVGPGDCALAFEVAKQVKQVYAIDVSEEMTKAATLPQNFQLILSNGVEIPVPEGSADVSYSNQLMEHLHPDDAFNQVQGIYKALAKGGVYICITPNRLSGPHDISQYFDTVATGFHLKEYTVTELNSLFKTVGFSKVQFHLLVKTVSMIIPTFPILLLEAILSIFPHSMRISLTTHWPLRVLFDNARLIGTK